MNCQLFMQKGTIEKEMNPMNDNAVPPVNNNASVPPVSSNAAMPQEDFEFSQKVIKSLSEYFSERVVGQEALKKSLITAIIADGHILLESVPGLAKTTAAKAISDAVNGHFPVFSVRLIFCPVISSARRSIISIPENSRRFSDLFSRTLSFSTR